MTIAARSGVPPGPLDSFRALSDCSPAARAAFAACCREARFETGARLVRRFHPSSRLLLLREGIAKMVGVSVNGIERILHVYRPGETVGTSPFLEDRDAAHEVVAMTPAVALAVDREAFLRVAGDHPDVALAVTRELYDRLSRMSRRILEATTVDVPVRLAGILLDFAGDGAGDREGFVPLVHPLTHRTLAQIVAASRPHVSAVLAELEAAGAVHRWSSGLLVRPDALREILRAEGLEGDR